MKQTILFLFILISILSNSQTSVEKDWAIHFPPVLDFETFTIVDMEKDNQGSLYLLEVREVGGNNEYITVKILMSSWTMEWFEFINVNGYEYTWAVDLDIDNTGNCYVAGFGRPDTNKFNYIIVKYNPAGKQEWAATYALDAGLNDRVNDMFVDNLGNAYLTGYSHEESEYYGNATTVKYNSDGVMQWKSTYIDSNIYYGEGKGLVVDNSGNVYVACQTSIPSPDYLTLKSDFLTIKYDSAGIEQWIRFTGSDVLNDQAQFIGIDNSGTITVGGTSYDSANYPKGYLIQKFNPDGSSAGGGNTYNSLSTMRGMAVSPQGNVYVTGSGYGMNADYSTVKFNSYGSSQWEKFYNGGFYDQPSDIKIDPDENIYVTGYSSGSASQGNTFTVKYNSSGDSLWSDIYSHQNFPNSIAQKIILDESGDMYAAINYSSGTIIGNELIKLNSNGVYQGAYNYKCLSQPTSIKEDPEGNIYITGFGGFNQTMWDFITMKCDSSGNIIWIRTYNGPGNAADQANDMELDDEGNVYITGGSIGIDTDFDFTTIKYNSSGNEQWVVRYNGPAFDSDIASNISVDADGNIYVSGSSLSSNSGSDIATIKYNNLGQLQWVKRYNGTSDGNDLAQGVETDLFGNVYVAGTSDSTGSLHDYVTLKYDPSGNAEWIRRYNGPDNDGDQVSSMSLDKSGNVYVTGWSFGNSTQSDYATVKYTTSGAEQWAARWDDPANSFDYANDIAVDGDGNVYITGISQGMGTGNDFTTVKYNSTGDQQWAVPYNGQSNGSDIAYHIALDNSGDIYVTGSVDDNNGITIVKYNNGGIQQWEKEYNFGEYQQIPTDLLVDKTGHVYLIGNSFNSYERFWNIVKYVQDGFIPTGSDEKQLYVSGPLILQIYPNPFGSATTISYTLPASGFITLTAYNMLGVPVKTLVNETQNPGEYHIDFSPGNVSSGLYFIQLTIGGQPVETRKILLVK